MGLQLSRSAGGFDNPSDSQSEILREMARKRASDNTWNRDGDDSRPGQQDGL